MHKRKRISIYCINTDEGMSVTKTLDLPGIIVLQVNL